MVQIFNEKKFENVQAQTLQGTSSQSISSCLLCEESRQVDLSFLDADEVPEEHNPHESRSGGCWWGSHVQETGEGGIWADDDVGDFTAAEHSASQLLQELIAFPLWGKPSEGSRRHPHPRKQHCRRRPSIREESHSYALAGTKGGTGETEALIAPRFFATPQVLLMKMAHRPALRADLPKTCELTAKHGAMKSASATLEGCVCCQ
eukprot:4345292-Amphidinium_carterae.1